jgi:hypothetical protein
MIKTARKEAKLRPSRLNHEKRTIRYLSFARKLKKSRRENKRVCKRLLGYLNRLIKLLEDLQKRYHPSVTLWQQNRLMTIYTLKSQQEQLYLEKQPKVEQRIVSLYKPYVRPIIRGGGSKGCGVWL